MTPKSIPCYCGDQCPHLAKAIEFEQQKRPRLAEAELHRVLIDAPRCYQARSMLGRILAKENRARFGVFHVDQAIAERGPLPALLTQRAHLLFEGTHIEAAIAAAREATAKAPNDIFAWSALLLALYAKGEHMEAVNIIGQLDARFTDRSAYRRTAAMILSDLGDLDRALARLTGELPPIEQFDRGRIKAKLGRYRDAWVDWMAAQGDLRAQGCNWPEANYRRQAGTLAEIASPERRKFLKAAPAINGGPIFITGFPRSGTTMIEAVIAAHPKVIGGDELPFLFELTQRLPNLLRVMAPYPRCLMASAMPENAGMIELARDLYLAKAREKIGYAARARLFTDKMLSNEKHLLLLSLLFPASPMFRVERHPLDVFISNMSYWIMHDDFASCSPISFAKNYALTLDLFDYLREVLPEFRVMEFRYEDFVREPLDRTDAILAFAGLKPDPQCYDFHKSSFHSRTISARQIKEPVSEKAIGRYQPFLEFIEPEVLKLLAPAIARGGYSL